MLQGTFSITARCPRTGQFGVAVASKYLAVGAVVPFVRAGVGAVATQARGNPLFGPEGLDPPSGGLRGFRRGPSSSASAPRTRTGNTVKSTRRPAGRGRSACHTGAETVDWAGHRTGEDCTVAGNILTGPEVLDAMFGSFEANPEEPLAKRLLAALLAGDQVGGDRRGKQSAALVVVHTEPYPVVNIRVDDHPEATVELQRIFDLFQEAFPKSIR